MCKVLLILADGMRPDALADKPAAQKYVRLSRSTMQGHTVFPSVTLPCHMSLFHSVDPARHGTTTNDYMPQVRPIPGLFDVLHAAGRKCAFFYDWENLRDIGRPGTLTRSYFVNSELLGAQITTPQVAQECMDYLRQTKDADFTFLYMNYPDEAGHDHGWMSPEYHAAVTDCWDIIDRVIGLLDEDYTVIITADHGGHDRNHGLDIPEDMTIPLFIWQNGLAPGELPRGAGIKDIAPTVAKLLGVKPDKNWEGRALL